MDEDMNNEVFNAAIDMYTNLLVEQKDLIFRIMDVAYAKGYEAARRDIVAAMRAEEARESDITPPELPDFEKPKGPRR